MKRLRRFLRNLFPTASIGTYLTIMVALSTLPLLGFAAVLLLELERSQFQALKVNAGRDAQAIGRSIERKISDMETTLTLVANSPELREGNLEAFYKRVGASLEGSSMYVLLVRRDGTQLVNTRMPWGTPLRPMSNIASLQEALRSGKSTLSGVFFGMTSQRWVVNITMPVSAANPAGVAAVVLTQDAASLASHTSRENLPPRWSAALLDDKGKVIVASGVEDRPPGQAFPASWLELMFGGNNNTVFYQDGEQYLLGYAQVTDWPWRIAVWGPVSSAQQTFVTAWKSLLLGSLVILALSLAVALIAAHQLRASIRTIACMADRIGQGDIVSPERTRILEANYVAVALSNASFDRAEAEERIHFILQELVHRTKNILSLVQAMMRQLARGADSVEDFQRAVSGRLAGLAQSIEALARQEWGGIPLATLVDLQMATVVGSDDRVDRGGPDLLVNASAVQNLGLVFHELATNSVKYGALSVLEGRIRVEWAIEGEGSEEPKLRLTWTELHGPPVVAPTRRGFGSTVIERHAASSFSGEVTMDFMSSGLRWVLLAPLHAFIGANKP
ncbi:histidine kinase [Rhizobium sp. Root274]|uniref:sensor histidine kinase n=1 Tax=unclassified Rhizobium TaxID=2613769 RepID=UPI000713E708|nr:MULTISPECIES: sensor histidine kinase [unclassified Rhizobium]KQW31769.1 histidine kinase [Rhizobium sp. Root1240]KRD33309.1 histidine kinase [Rhizobium sp. Root274]